ncbi:hypothetical protein DSECCO2_476610 [anaerobic digester metagenome]
MVRTEDGCHTSPHHNAGRRRGLGALLVHVDECLMEDPGDEEVSRAVHPREVGVVGKRRRHPHRRKHPRKRIPRLQRELREEDPDVLRDQGLPQAGKPLRVQGLFRSRQVVFFGEKDEHREFGFVPVRVRHLEHLEGLGLRVRIDGIPVHHRDSHRRVRSNPELLIRCLVHVELFDPGAFEVDRVRDHEPGHRVDRTRREEVADLLFGLFLHPPVDRRSRPIGVLDEVEVRDVCPIPVSGRLNILWEEGVRLLRPEGVCGAERVVAAPAVQPGVDRGKPLPPEGVVLREVQHRPDLVGGRAACALVGDRESRRDAVGREEEVISRVRRVGREAPVEVEREPIVPGRHVAGAIRRIGMGDTGIPGNGFAGD